METKLLHYISKHHITKKANKTNRQTKKTPSLKDMNPKPNSGTQCFPETIRPRNVTISDVLESQGFVEPVEKRTKPWGWKALRNGDYCWNKITEFS